MARLNETPALVDSFDNLRRKFLRQNRDIARVNSNQSLRIRGLENECARLLSENLELRGKVLRLEKEIEDDKSQRVADHALQIKQKMEAQLVELGSLLASFGVEPPTKRQTAAAPRRADKPVRLSLSSETASPPRKPPVLSPSEAESLAAQEGRLPPIYEHKTFPRQTLSRDEILALQSDDGEVATSPEVGPPPVSRLHRNESTKTVEPTKKPTATTVQTTGATARTKVTAVPKEQAKERAVEETKVSQPVQTSGTVKAKSEPEKKTSTLRVLNDNAKPTKQPTSYEPSNAPSVAPTVVPISVPSTPTSKPTGKRKFAVNDENAAIRGMKAGDAKEKASAPISKAQADGNAPIRELKNPRSIRSLVNSRKEANEGHAEVKTAAGGRKPLSAKSTNEDISSPRKHAVSEGKPKSNSHANKSAHLEGRMRNRMKTPLTVEIPDATPPTTVDIIIDDANTDKKTEKSTTALPSKDQDEPVPVADNDPLPEPESDTHCPRTPPPSSTLLTSQRLVPMRAEGRDTPPPADISSQGETSRPNRRSRASVSYAEPNLRDKMRRPTKELFDAVAGEGKYVQRQSHHTHQDAQSPANLVVAKADAVNLPIEQLPQKTGEPVQTQPAAEQKSTSGPASTAEKANGASATAEQDPYEFTISSSPTLETDDEESEVGTGKGKTATKKSRASLKTTRRSSTANVREEGSSAADRHTRPSAARKRTSMVALKRGSMLDDDEDDAADSSYEPPASESVDGEAIEGRALSTRDRISRRRSMML
ncbi:hypothetical protein SEUCBS139899_006088 [Sporothrix eucalyptigena]|uniref:Shugoshin family protein n=1 Tax=Sporothrix eucalyptigena TaxID=1812306 RepID=A0ABP0C9Y4_9PEZI